MNLVSILTSLGDTGCQGLLNWGGKNYKTKAVELYATNHYSVFGIFFMEKGFFLAFYKGFFH